MLRESGWKEAQAMAMPWVHSRRKESTSIWEGRPLCLLASFLGETRLGEG